MLWNPLFFDIDIVGPHWTGRMELLVSMYRTSYFTLIYILLHLIVHLIVPDYIAEFVVNQPQLRQTNEDISGANIHHDTRHISSNAIALNIKAGNNIN